MKAAWTAANICVRDLMSSSRHPLPISLKLVVLGYPVSVGVNCSSVAVRLSRVSDTMVAGIRETFYWWSSHHHQRLTAGSRANWVPPSAAASSAPSIKCQSGLTAIWWQWAELEEQVI